MEESLSLDMMAIETISKLASEIDILSRQAAHIYTPLVEDILSTCSRDKIRIEHTLDGLLSFCGFDPALELYRRLCRYYWDIDPAATAFYVNAYRMTWDSD